jgi:hypothetical protein
MVHSSARIRRISACILVAVIAAVGLVVGSTASNAQPNAEYSEFQGLSQEELETLHIKFSYLCGSFTTVWTHVYTAHGTATDLSPFTLCRRPEFEYWWDRIELRGGTASIRELQAAIDSVGTLPEITAGGVDSLGCLSFSLLYLTDGTARCFEAVVAEERGRSLLLKLRQGFASNPEVVADLTGLACANDMLQPPGPADVTDDVHLRFTAIREVNDSRVFVGRVTVTNESSVTLPAPMILVITPEHAAIDLLNADDRTCQLEPRMKQYIELPVSGDGLPADQSVEVELLFGDPSRTPIVLYWQRDSGKRVTPKVYAGPGDR